MPAKHYSEQELNIIRQYYPQFGGYVAWKALRIKGYNRTVKGVCCTAQRYGIRCENASLNKGKNKKPYNQTPEHISKLKAACNKIRNCFDVGTIRKTNAGTYIKIAMPDKWVRYSRYLYAQHYGEIPPNHVVIFKDGNPDNIVIDNLVLITCAEHTRLIRMKHAHRIDEVYRKAAETKRANRRAALRQKYGSIAEALAAGEVL